MEFIFRLIPLFVTFLIISRFLKFISEFILDLGKDTKKINTNKKDSPEEKTNINFNKWQISENEKNEKRETPDDYYNIDEAVSLAEQKTPLADRKKTKKSKQKKHQKITTEKKDKSSSDVFKREIFDRNNIQKEILRGMILKEILDKPRSKNPYKFR